MEMEQLCETRQEQHDWRNGGGLFELHSCCDIPAVDLWSYEDMNHEEFGFLYRQKRQL